MSHSQNHLKFFVLVFFLFTCLISFSLYYIKQCTISPVYYNYKPLKLQHSFFLQQSTIFLHTNQVKKVVCFACSLLFSSKVIPPGCFCFCPKFACAKLYFITLCYVSGEKVSTGLRDSSRSQTILKSVPSKFSSDLSVF